MSQPTEPRSPGTCGCTCDQCRHPITNCGGCGAAACDVRPRLTSAAPNFPHSWPKAICYFTVTNGNVMTVRTRDEMRAAVKAAQLGLLLIYAVWPGQWRTDLFLVDDVDVLAAELGIEGAT